MIKEKCFDYGSSADLLLRSNLWPEWKALNAHPKKQGHLWPADPKNCCYVTQTEKLIYFNFHFNLLMRMGEIWFNGWQNSNPCCCCGVLGQFAAIIAGEEGKWDSVSVRWLDNGSSVQCWHEPWAAIPGHKNVSQWWNPETHYWCKQPSCTIDTNWQMNSFHFAKSAFL